MPNQFPSKKVAIVGVYLTEQSRSLSGTTEGRQLEAVKGAVADAGLEIKDVDGLATPGGSTEVGRWARLLRQPLTPVGGNTPMGATTVNEAAAFVGSGICDVAVCVQGNVGMRIGPTTAVKPITPGGGGKRPRLWEWDPSAWGMFISAWYAQMARRHMYEFGTTSEQLAHVAVAMRHHAILNPRTFMGKRGDITVDDVVRSRMIADPLHLLDCCVSNDGAHAIVVTSAERARNLKKKPVYVLGGCNSSWNSDYMAFTDNYYPTPATITSRRAMAQAGITHDDIDVMGIYDCFTITVVRELEDCGFCKLGEGGPFVAEGHLRLGGKFPTNLDGGLLSYSHSGQPGLMGVIEVVRQLRGNDVEPERQVPNAKIGFAHKQGMAVLGQHGSTVLAVD